MKKKIGFVTNSSSASFIISIKSSIQTLEGFTEYLRNELKEYINRKNWESDYEKNREFRIKTVERVLEDIEMIAPGIYKLNDFTGMLNDIDQHLSDWIKHLLINKAIGKYKFAIEDISVEVVDENNMW